MPLQELDRHPFEAIRPPADLTPDGLRVWVEQTCSYLGVTPTELSRAAGIAPSTVNKFLVDPDGKRSLSSRTLSSLVKGALSLHSERFSANYATLLGSSRVKREGFQSPPIRVAASLRRDTFKEHHLWAMQDQFFVSAPIPNSLEVSGLVGLLVTDGHAEGVFPRGTVVIAAKFSIEGGDQIEMGDFFVVSRRDGAGLTELTLRHFIVSPKGDMWLISQAPRADRAPDNVYLGQASPEGMYGDERKFSPTVQSGYTLEYKVISAIQPYSGAFKELKLPE
jgi:hypothetical protein